MYHGNLWFQTLDYLNILLRKHPLQFISIPQFHFIFILFYSISFYFILFTSLYVSLYIAICGRKIYFYSLSFRVFLFQPHPLFLEFSLGFFGYIFVFHRNAPNTIYAIKDIQAEKAPEKAQENNNNSNNNDYNVWGKKSRKS